MRRPGRIRTAVLAGSAAVHAMLLALAAGSHGVAFKPEPPPPVLQVEIVPAYLLPAPARSAPRTERPAPSPRAPRPRLARRPADEAPIAPLVLPAAPAGPPAPPGVDEGVRRALQGGLVGCANPDAAGLDKAAREACLGRLGAGAADAPFYAAPIGKAKRAEFDRAAARKRADREWRAAPMPPGLSTSDAPGGLTGLGQSRPDPADVP